MGIGLTEAPAADVKGVLTASEEKEDTQIEAEVAEQKEEKISQNTKTNVSIRKVEAMKIENITDINDESLQTLKASAIHEYIQKSLQDASEKFTSEKREKDSVLAESQEKHDGLLKEHDSLKAELE